jgi:hypothetical protein
VNDLLLGVIAGAVVLMAIIQVAALVVAAKAARRVDRLAERFEQDIRPVVASLQALTADAARATAVAAAQVDRADRLFGELAERVEQTMTVVQETLIAPAREGFAWLAGLKAVLGAFRDLRNPTRPRPGRVEGEDALFIG